MRVVETEHCTLYLGDCLEVLPTLDAVDAVFTSPPYGQQRDYGEKITDWRALVSGAMVSVVANEKTQFLVNLGLIHRDGEVIEYWNDLVSDMRNRGYRLFGWYVWDKGFGLPGDWNGRLAPAHEWVFHFNVKARKANKWVTTNQRKASGSGLRSKDGTLKGIQSPDKCGQEHKIADSVFRIFPHMLRRGPESGHPAVFPVDLPEQMCLSFTDADETVLDPFMGSGTTGVACIKTGRKFIGIEKEPSYFEISLKRIKEAERLAKCDLFKEPNPKLTQRELLPKSEVDK